MQNANISDTPIHHCVKSVTADGMNCYYDIHHHPAPTMAPVVFVGDELQDFGPWRMFIYHFSRITTVVELDLSLSGVSEQLPVSNDFDKDIGVLVKLLDAENFDKVYLVSSSNTGPALYQFTRNIRNTRTGVVEAGVIKQVPKLIQENMFASMAAIQEEDIDLFIDLVMDGRLVDKS
jgi:hypothetical protein